MNGTAEEQGRRRRWINLAELVGVASVIVAGLGLYQGWSERREDRQEAIRAAASTERRANRFEINAVAARDGAALALTPDARHPVQEMTVTFPTALGVPARDMLAGEIERDWFGDALLKATDGGADDRTGTLPVMIRVTYLDGDDRRVASSIHDIVWRTQGRTLQGRSLRLLALRHRQRRGSVTKIDALWQDAVAKR